MDFFILCLFGLIYCSCMIITLERVNGKVMMSRYNLMRLAFAGVYGVVFPVCYGLTIAGYNTDAMKGYILDFDSLTIIAYYLLIIVVTAAYFFILKRKRQIINSSIVNDDDENVDIGKRKTSLVPIIIFFIGIISDYLYMRPYGSYSNYMLYSGAIRSGVITVNNPFSFLIVFRSCIGFSSYLFLARIRVNNKINVVNLMFFIVSSILSLRVLYSNRGRLGFAIYFLIIVLFIVRKKRGSARIYMNIKTIRRYLGIGILFIFGLYLSGILLNRNITNSILMQINKEVSFIYANAVELLKNIKIEDYRWFKDIILFPVYILPTSIWQTRMGITTASSDLTYIMSGFRKGQGGVYGENPIDLFSLSYMQAGVLGIIVTPIVYALLFSFIFKRVNKIRDSQVREIISIFVIIDLGFETLFYADPQHIVHRSFAFIVFLILEPILNRLKIRV